MTDTTSKRLQTVLSDTSTLEMNAIRTKIEGELNDVKSLVPPGIGPPSNEAEDLDRAGQIASNFMVGLDSMADVLMLLVMKFGRAAQLVRLLLLGIILGTVLLTVNLFLSWHLSNVQEEIGVKQAQIQEQQSHILNRQKSTEIVAGEAKVIATAAEKTASEVKDSAPSVVVDAKGRPQLILKVQDPSNGDATTDATKTVNPKRSTLENDGKSLQTPVTF